MKPMLSLSETERSEVQKFVRQGKANARTLIRAWTLLKLADGWDEARIADWTDEWFCAFCLSGAPHQHVSSKCCEKLFRNVLFVEKDDEASRHHVILVGVHAMRNSHYTHVRVERTLLEVPMITLFAQRRNSR